jgi:ligand-binding sensor domain-containing protein
VSAGLSDSAVSSIAFLAEGSVDLYAGTPTGVFRYQLENATWTTVNCGLTTSLVEVLATWGGDVYAGTDGQGLFRSSDDGETWIGVNSGLTDTRIQSLAQSGSNVYAGTNYRGLFLSTDCGATWRSIDTGLTNADVRALAVFPSDARTQTLLAGTYGGGVFRSTDSGTSWNPANSGLVDNEMSCFEVAPGFEGYDVYAGSYPGGVYRSTDEGVSWQNITSNLPNYGHWFGTVNAISVSAENPGDTNVFVGTGTGVFRSTNKGKSWISASNGIAYIQYGVECLVDIPSGGGGTALVAGTDNGIYLSTNDGTNWSAIDSGLADKWAWSFAVNNGNLFVGTFHGVWRRPLSDVVASVSRQGARLPLAFLLEQNYPNPFNPSTTIRYDIPKDSHVILKVYNVLGQEVATLVDEMKRPGRYSVIFDGAHLASGIYIYRVKAGSYSESRKLILLR